MTHLDDKKKLSPVEHPYADDTIVYNTETNASDLQDLKNLEECWEQAGTWSFTLPSVSIKHLAGKLHHLSIRSPYTAQRYRNPMT